uniref:ATP synthase subunit a n=1 Tax=Nepa hoffmanni TaxID=796936 RepID=A0A0U2ICU9_9HEMI|nr:ATP synthase F0 subunit 6 [Nepa hoffmanni]ALG35803.1 ATP synthase F0 subunit 6 [Nepa hoffmanni]
MMTNLFSTFDPATSTSLSLNWTSTFLGIMIMPYMYWVTPNRYTKLITIIINKLHAEFKTLMGQSKGFTLLMIALFMMILFNNAMGLLPYIFTSSSHMVFTMTLALPVWIAVMMFGWINKTQAMFSHLIPMGTPPLLMPFMVCIETASNLIRPGALAVRLMANMFAGHLSMSLLGNSTMNSSNILIMMMIMLQMGFMLFEFAVALIQAYVFSMLSTLYTSEVAYEKKT